MIAGGAALSGELLFAVCLTAFAVLASLALGLGVVEAAVPAGEPVPVRAVMRPLALGVVFAVTGAVAFFILFPRRQLERGRAPGDTGTRRGHERLLRRRCGWAARAPSRATPASC